MNIIAHVIPNFMTPQKIILSLFGLKVQLSKFKTDPFVIIWVEGTAK